MPKDYVPASDLKLRAFALEVSTKLSIDPASFGIDVAMAAGLLEQAQLFAEALTAATSSETRGVRTVFVKNAHRRELVSALRRVIRQVQGTAAVTNEQRQSLGIPLRNVAPVPQAVPAVGPVLSVREVREGAVQIELRDAEHPDNRGKPPASRGAVIFIATGPTPPAPDSPQWQFAGQVTRRLSTLRLPWSSAARTVWISANWFTQRGETSPASGCVQVNLPAMQPAAVPIKLAA